LFSEFSKSIYCCISRVLAHSPVTIPVQLFELTGATCHVVIERRFMVARGGDTATGYDGREQ